MLESLVVTLALLVGSDPVSLVKALIREEVALIEGAGLGDPFGKEAVDRLYTTDLAAAYAAVMDRQARLNEPLLDGDPITGHQEYCPLRGVAIELTARGDEAAVVTARFMSQWCYPEAGPAVAGEVTEVIFDLVRVGGEWRIDDFANSHYGSFRALLTQLMGP